MQIKSTINAFAALLLMQLGSVNQMWAGDVTTLYERGYETAWTSADVAEGEWVGTGNVSGDPAVLTVSGGNSVVKTLSYTGAPILTYDAVWNIGSKSGKNDAANRCIFKIGDIASFEHYPRSASNWARVVVNGTEIKKITGNPVAANALWTIHMVVNTYTHVITEFTVSSDNEAMTVSLSDIEEEKRTLPNTSVYNTLTLATEKGTNPTTSLNKIQVQQETQDVASYSYTVNYKEGDNVVKTVTGSLAEGSAIPVLTALDGEDVYEGNHYLIVDDVPSWTISSTEAENVHDVAVRVPYSTTVNVYYVVDGVKDAEPSSTLNYTETDAKVAQWHYYFPYYITRDSKWYKATLKNGTDFGETDTFNTTGGTLTKEVEYIFDADVAYFGESQWTGDTGITYSNGERSSGKSNQSYTYNDIALSAGTYEMIVPGISYSTCTVKMGDTEIGTIPQGGGSFVFEKANDDNVSFNFSGNMRQLDYFLIKKNPKATVTIGEAGFATYSNAKYALDFTSVDGLKAYAVKVNDAKDAVELTQVTSAVPSSTGLLLQGAAKSYDVPAVATAEALGDNDLIVTTGSTISKEDGYVYYGLRKLSTDEVGFAQMDLDSFTPSAGKAYLKVSEVVAARMAFLNLVGNGTTGIANVNANVCSASLLGSSKNANRVYDLQGRRVANMQKGLYIIGGKKLIVK